MAVLKKPSMLSVAAQASMQDLRGMRGRMGGTRYAEPLKIYHTVKIKLLLTKTVELLRLTDFFSCSCFFLFSSYSATSAATKKINFNCGTLYREQREKMAHLGW